MVGPGARPVRAWRVPPGQAGPDAAWDQPWDAAVVGGGNAALVSALTAADSGARVLLLERAPAVFRGGNSRHTRNVRCAHEAADGYVTGPVPERGTPPRPGRRGHRPEQRGPRGPDHRGVAVGSWLDERARRPVAARRFRGTLGLGQDQPVLPRRGKALVNATAGARCGQGSPSDTTACVRGAREVRERGTGAPRSSRTRPGYPPGHGEGGDRRQRRLRGEHRLAEALLGRCRAELPCQGSPLQRRPRP